MRYKVYTVYPCLAVTGETDLKFTVGKAMVITMNQIITIGREFGSGGREFGRRLAEELGFEYYDNEILTEISNHTSMSEEYIKQVTEQRPHRLYPITVGHTLSFEQDYTFNQIQKVYCAQIKILKGMAEKSDCVIVGRCADYILKDMNPYRIFIYADMDSRVKRCIKRNENADSMTEKEIVRQIKKIDRDRARYYSFCTSQKWGEKENYDMCINTTDTVIKEIVPVIAKIFKK